MGILNNLKEIGIATGQAVAQVTIKEVGKKAVKKLEELGERLEEKAVKRRAEQDQKIAEYVKAEAEKNPSHYYMWIHETDEDKTIRGKYMYKSTYEIYGQNGLPCFRTESDYSLKYQKITVCDSAGRKFGEIIEKKHKTGILKDVYRYKVVLNKLKGEIKNCEKRKTSAFMSAYFGWRVILSDKGYLIVDDKENVIAELITRPLSYGDYWLINADKQQDMQKVVMLFLTAIAYKESLRRQ